MIRQQMQDTRAALADKLETLEQQVVGTVSGTTAAVAETVENVKEAVQETVEAVKESVQEGVASVRDAFDLSRQVDQHPWLFLAGSVALGFLGGRLLEGSARQRTRQSRLVPASNGRGENLTDRAPMALPATPERNTDRGFLSTLTSEFSGEINKVKSLAIAAGLGLVRDVVTQSAPASLRPRLAEVIDGVTVKLGGEPVPGPLWTSSCETERRLNA